MKMKKVCELTGLTERTIRFYVEKDLLSPARHFQNGREYRDYSMDDISLLRQIATLRRSGFTLEEIHLMEQDPASVPSVAASWKERISELAEHHQVLLQTCRKTDFSGMDFRTLADILETASGQRMLPPEDVPVNFGRLDGESPEQKEKEIRRRNERLSAQISHGEKCILFYIIFSLIREIGGIVIHLISGTFDFTDIIALGIVIMLFIFLYLGYNWSRIILLIFSGLAILSSVPYIFTVIEISPLWLILLALFLLLYNAALFLVLLLHKGIQEYLSYQKSVR